MNHADLGGTVRTHPVSSTLSAIASLQEVCGITRLGNVTGLDHIGIPVWIAVRPLAQSLSVSQGKGLTDELARASAGMEAIELYCAENFLPPSRFESFGYAERDREFINVSELPMRSDVKFSEETRVRWAYAPQVGGGDGKFVPLDLIDRGTAFTSRANALLSSSNGLASGNCEDECFVHALSELIERDQFSFWLWNRSSSPKKHKTKLKLDSIEDKSCRDLVSKIRSAGLDLAVWYVTTNISVPVFTCSIWDTSGKTIYQQRASGHGCHPYKRIALSRALAEAVQSRLTLITGSRDDICWKVYRDEIPMDHLYNRHHAELHKNEVEIIDYNDITEAPRTFTIESLKNWLISAAKIGNIDEIYVVKLSPYDWPIHVMQVIAPKMEASAHNRMYVPGRRMCDFIGRSLAT